MTHQAFREYENNLLEKIKNNESPFLGLFEDYFTGHARKKIISYIQTYHDPFKRYIELLKKYPAVLSTILIVQLLEDFGEHGYFEVYPVLEKIFGFTMANNQKEILWKSFRRACLFNLGISVSPRTSGPLFMVKEYLRQVGLPLRFADRFTQQATSYIKQAGVPDVDDPELLRLWQDGLIEGLSPKIVKQAIQRDDTCYFTQLFIRCFSEQNNQTIGQSRIESLISRSIQNGPQIGTAKRAAIPQIVFREFEYGILLPGSDDINQWEISSDNTTRKYTSRSDERFISFENPLPLNVSIINDTGFQWNYSLWGNKANNKFMIFSIPEGKFIRCASLTEHEIFLDPGKYLLLMRFEPDNEGDIELFYENPSLYTKKISLDPGEIFTIHRGPAAIKLKADEKPVLNFNKEPLQGIRGNELYPAEELTLKIIIPKEMMEANTEFHITIKSNSLGEIVKIPFPSQQENEFSLDIGKVMDKYWKPGVSRILFEVFRKGIKRSLARKSAVIWNGLLILRKRILFQCSKLPENLFKDNCENLEINTQAHELSFQDETNRFFKMAFKDGLKILYFTWTVPGIFLSLMDYKGSERTENGIGLGQTVSITTSSRKAITIFASEPGTLQMGNFSIKVDFSRIGYKKIHLASLIEYLEPGQNILTFTSENLSEPVPIIKLVSPFEAQEYHIESKQRIRKIKIVVSSSIQAIRFFSKNLIDNKIYDTTVSFDNIGHTSREELIPEISATFFMDNQQSCTIYFPETGWPNGLWIFSFMLKSNDRWGLLTSNKGKIHADGIMSVGNNITPNPDEIFWVLNNNYSQKELTEIFCHLHKALKITYTRQSWPHLSWLEHLWIKLSENLDHSIDTNLKILELITDSRSVTQEDNNIPLLHPGAVLTRIFCMDKTWYPENKLSNSGFHITLRFISKLKNPYQAFSDNYFDLAALFAFSNAAQVAINRNKPENFQMQTYIESLKARDVQEKWRLLHDDQWMPARGDILGPMHYRYVLTKFQEKYSNIMENDSQRLGTPLFLVRQINSFSLSNFVDKPGFVRFSNEIDIGCLDDKVDTQIEYIDDETATSIESQKLIIKFISLFAQVCRCEARHFNIMKKFKTKIYETCNYSPNSMNKHLGFLLYLAQDLLCFYLLLWELVFSADCDQPRRIYV